MENQAYKWLNAWVESGSDWDDGSDAGIWDLYRSSFCSDSVDYVGFRKDIKQLLDDAEAGRKLREEQG
jgi:hypothetical protein